MSVLLVVGVVVVVWLGMCLLFVAMCVSAKEADADLRTLAPDGPARRSRHSRRSRRAPALS